MKSAEAVANLEESEETMLLSFQLVSGWPFYSADALWLTCLQSQVFLHFTLVTTGNLTFEFLKSPLAAPTCRFH